MGSQRVRHDLECRHLVLEASLVAQKVKNLPAVWETGFNPWVGKIPWRRDRLSTPVIWPGEFHGLYSQQLELDMEHQTGSK